MAVHLPLSADAQAEARELMAADKNLLKPADGAPVLAIYQDVVLGIYYLTYDKPGTDTKDVKAFSSVYEAEMAYDQGLIALQTPIRVFTKKEIRDTTLGRILFNEVLPADYPYDNSVQTSKQLKKSWPTFSISTAPILPSRPLTPLRISLLSMKPSLQSLPVKMTTPLIQKLTTSLPRVTLRLPLFKISSIKA